MTCSPTKKFNEFDERLQRGCRGAGIHDFMASLPDGYSTAVGAQGVALSGVSLSDVACDRI